jgi:hypothetical protein
MQAHRGISAHSAMQTKKALWNKAPTGRKGHRTSPPFILPSSLPLPAN